MYGQASLRVETLPQLLPYTHISDATVQQLCTATAAGPAPSAASPLGPLGRACEAPAALTRMQQELAWQIAECGMQPFSVEEVSVQHACSTQHGSWPQFVSSQAHGVLPGGSHRRGRAGPGRAARPVPCHAGRGGAGRGRCVMHAAPA